MKANKIGLLMGMISMIAAQNNMFENDRVISTPKSARPSQELYKRKKCKSCKHMDNGRPCYTGKFVKPKFNACKEWEKK